MTTKKERAEARKTLARRFKQIVPIEVTQRQIYEGVPCKGALCPVKLATAVAINVPHGYIHVDASGIRVTRRPDYREVAVLPKAVQKFLILYDNAATRAMAKPFRSVLKFFLTTPVVKHDRERMDRVNELRRGQPTKDYPLRSRITGLTWEAPKKA